MQRGQWFSLLFGFKESSYWEVKSNISIEDGVLVSKANGRRFQVGEFSTPSLKELRGQVNDSVPPVAENSLKLSHIAVRDIYEAHQYPEYKGAMFQVASQFNCLEFISAAVTPEVGVSGYINDPTQGPACSLACPAATVYRNYYARTPKGEEGQTQNDQINNLDGIEEIIDNETNKFWITRNGYTNSTNQRLTTFNKALDTKWERQDLLDALKIGIHSNVGVISTKTTQKDFHTVNQGFCSAISISYSQASEEAWCPIARIVLDACYEAILLATILQVERKEGSNIVVLTFIGGGVFGNKNQWIYASIGRACALLSHYDLDVRIAHYRYINQESVKEIQREYELALEKMN